MSTLVHLVETDDGFEFNIPLLLLGLTIVLLFSTVLWYVVDFFVGDSLLSTIIVLAIVLLALNPPDEH